MRKQLHITHPLSIYDASRLLPEYPRSKFIETTVNIENGVIKKKQPDNIDVPAVVISESPGRLIFILEPTRRDLGLTNFKLETTSNLKIRYHGNIFQSKQIVFTKPPIHPIIHTSFLMKDPDHVIQTAGFDKERNERWKHAAFTPDQYTKFFASDLLQTIRNKDGYSEMILDNPFLPQENIHERPVTAKFLGTCQFDGVTCDQYVLLETSSYFKRCLMPVEKGCILKDDLHTFRCVDVSYPVYPYHPVLIIKPVDSQLSA